LIERIRARLLSAPEHLASENLAPEASLGRPPVAAAVLIGLIRRPDGFSVLYTERSPDLRVHSGQVAFPGGKIDPGDHGPAEAALREAHEEVALAPGEANVLGYMPLYFTGTNYVITPVVAVVAPSAPFVPNPSEVRSVFEVPLEYLMVSGSYTTHHDRRGETDRTTWQVMHAGMVIWGITANLTRQFHDLALAGEGD
jgi:8-oxo-dGTP pyrophosphatase MutT (NUDIX family)